MLAAQQQQPVIAAATQAAPSPRKARAMKPRKPSAAATDAPVASTIDAVNDALAATSIADNVVANETENAMRPTSPEDKDKDKDVAVTMSTTDGPVSPGSAYVSMVAKRLRTLKKRLARAEKYEEDLAAGRAKLNEDQLLAVEKKGEVVALVKELEEVLKQMEDKDAEDTKLARKAKRAEAIEKQKTIAAAVDEVKTSFKARSVALLRLFHAVNVILPQMPVATVLAPAHKDALLHFQRSLVGSMMDQVLDAAAMETTIQSAAVALDKFLGGSDETIVGELSFTDIHTLVDRVFAYLQSPSPVVALQPERTSFTVQEEVPVDSTRATAPFVDYGMPMTTTAQDNIAASMFMQPSTVRPTTVTFGDFHDAGNATNVLPAAPTAPTTTAYDLTNRANLHYDPAIIATGSAVLGGSGTDAASIAATAGTSDFGGVSSLDSEDLSVVEESVPAPSAVEPKRQQQSRPPRQHSPRRQSRQYSTGDGAPRGASRGGRGRGGSRGGRGGAARGISGGEARKE